MSLSLAASIKASPPVFTREAFQFTKFEGVWGRVMHRLIVKDSLSEKMIHFSARDAGRNLANWPRNVLTRVSSP